MCGILGIIGKSDAAEAVLDGLKRLEYRGYDSAGIAALNAQGRLDRRRAVGKLANLTALLKEQPLTGDIAIGHTRWATHGAAIERNAHPHATERLAIVHNGIIENFSALRAELEAAGTVFQSDTDTEVCLQLIHYYIETEKRPIDEAFAASLARLQGAFALAVIVDGEENLMLAARRGSPLAIGRGLSGDGKTEAMYLGSDAYALAPFTNRVTYLEDGDWAILTKDGAKIFDDTGASVSRPEKISAAIDALVDKDGHRHFMAKEIHEQPEVVAHTLARYIDGASGALTLPKGTFDFTAIDKLVISACGTAFYAGQIAKYWFESWAGLHIETDIASELRYRDVPYTQKTGALFISQSGETADTLAALRDAKNGGAKIAAVVNVAESSIAREADIIFPMAAGPEIGVASTKAFTCQLTALACIALAAGKARGVLSDDRAQALVKGLLTLPRLLSQALTEAEAIETVAKEIAKSDNVLYIGRGVSFPLAMEGALKLKEISYIHAEGYAAGELKHGPIALVDKTVPIVVIAPQDKNFPKTISNMHEVIARDGKTLLISDEAGLKAAGNGVWRSIKAPTVEPDLAPIIYSPAIQLLAYYTATTKGTDVDQPRNLAKSVTVE